MKIVSTLLLAICFAVPAFSQVDAAMLAKPLGESWPTYSGDYSGKRYSSLKQITQQNVKNLTLGWTMRITPGAGGAIVGGEGDGSITAGGGNAIKGAVLAVNGILYVSTPDNAWAVDARDGRVLWHYFWRTRGATHIGNRGLGMYGNWLYMETPDNYLVSLDARTGEERWHKQIARFEEQYFSTPAPIIVGNHVLVGTGNDLDEPGILQSFDPENGAVQWKFYSTPQKAGDAGLETWANLDAAKHGGGQMWVPGSYDPDTHLYIIGTGNPSPAYTWASRGAGDNLYTCSLVAINVDTGKIAWYYQTSPHDTHDWDSSQTPILADIEINGRTRKVAMTAARNGYYFTVDRVTGEHLVTGKYSDAANWAKAVNAKGQPIGDPAKDFHVGGALVSPANGGVTNWPPPAYSPETGLFFVPQNESYAMYYLTETDPRGAMGLGGKEEQGLGSLGGYLTAIDPKNGKVAWRHKYPGTGGGSSMGLLTTAGRLLFGGDLGGNIVAYDPANGKTLWHSHIGQVSNAPETYMLDGHQYLLVAAGDTLFAFTLY
ncbi:MAG: acido-empty-quinoprotein group A [Acidobacteriota bacterium]